AAVAGPHFSAGTRTGRTAPRPWAGRRPGGVLQLGRPLPTAHSFRPGPSPGSSHMQLPNHVAAPATAREALLHADTIPVPTGEPTGTPVGVVEADGPAAT